MKYIDHKLKTELPKVRRDFYDQQEILLLNCRSDPRLTPEFLDEYDQTPTIISRYMNDDWD